jgi:hypothetical protein
MKIFLLLLSGVFSVTSSYSQSAKTDSITNLQVKNAVDLYNRFTDGEAPIFNGPEYIYYIFVMEGNPFFEKSGYTGGWVGFRGRIYKPVSLFFDIQRNQLVILNTDSLSPVVIQNEHVDSFHLYGHTFISLEKNNNENLYNTDFYDQLYNGRIQLMARRIKTMEQKIKNDQLTEIFYQKDRFYIHKEGLYYLVSNKKDVFKLFSDKKAALKKQMHKAHIKFRRKNFEDALIKTTVIYDQLTH